MGKISVVLLSLALWAWSVGSVLAVDETALPDLTLEPAEEEREPLIVDDYDGAVEIYKQDELIGWINQNQHLARVKADECQLVEDIQARAEKVKYPSYEFLWGDMLAWGVCVPKDAELGIHYMWLAANQGLPAALEQLGRYYKTGTLVQKDMNKAVILLRESSAMGFLKAQLQFAELLDQGFGSPYDYEDAYRWLHHAIIADKATHKKAEQLLAKLAERMPPQIVDKAKRSNQHY